MLDLFHNRDQMKKDIRVKNGTKMIENSIIIGYFMLGSDIPLLLSVVIVTVSCLFMI